jgi:hypothetical protein
VVLVGRPVAADQEARLHPHGLRHKTSATDGDRNLHRDKGAVTMPAAMTPVFVRVPAPVRMQGMRLDHLSFAAGPDGLRSTAARLGALLGEEFRDGGIHPRFGTRNMVLPLTQGTYVEVVAVLDHPASDKAPFGQAVRARSRDGGGWLGWVVSVDDMAMVEQRLGRQSVQGNRHRPDGVELRWRQIGVLGLQSDPQLPFFVQWQSPDELHPSAGSTGNVRLDTLEIAGDPRRVSDWLGNSVEGPLEDVDVDWVAPHGTPGIIAAKFATARGLVRI